jgi:outer membrane lipoprotein-sorting protein
MKSVITALLAAAMFLGAVSTGFGLPKVNDLLKKLDDLQTVRGDTSAKINLTQNKQGQLPKAYEFVNYRRDALDAFLMVITAPDLEKGNGYLKVGDDMWLYRRNTRTFQHINRDESIEGTDAKAGDFERRKLADLYTAATNADGSEKISEEMLGKVPVYKIDLIEKVNDVTYPRQVYWVERDTTLPRKVQSYSLSGALMQTGYYFKYTIIDGKYYLINGMFVDEFEGLTVSNVMKNGVQTTVTNKENKTILSISDISTKPVDPAVFTKAYLENLSK